MVLKSGNAKEGKSKKTQEMLEKDKSKQNKQKHRQNIVHGQVGTL